MPVGSSHGPSQQAPGAGAAMGEIAKKTGAVYRKVLGNDYSVMLRKSMPTCIAILSEKSSGSSVLQRLIASFARRKTREATRHNEDETLYWTKAASILRLSSRPHVR